jgi:hypothetical protein
MVREVFIIFPSSYPPCVERVPFIEENAQLQQHADTDRITELEEQMPASDARQRRSRVEQI